MPNDTSIVTIATTLVPYGRLRWTYQSCSIGPSQRWRSIHSWNGR